MQEMRKSFQTHSRLPIRRPLRSPIDNWPILLAIGRLLRTRKFSSEFTAVFCPMPRSTNLKNRPILNFGRPILKCTPQTALANSSG